MTDADSTPPRSSGVRSQSEARIDERPDGRYSQSLERGLAILRCFQKDRTVLGIAEIADELCISRSTTHRYVITLQALGFLEQERSRKYRLAPGVSDLGMAAVEGSGIREVARPLLEDLCTRSSHSASLAVLDGAEVCWLDTTNGRGLWASPGIPLIQAGSRAPAHGTAEGKILIAFAPEESRSELLANLKRTRPGPNTIRSKRALADELDVARTRGYAVADEEQAAGVRAVAAPVRDRTEEAFAAISLTLASSDVPLATVAAGLGDQVIACADALSELIAAGR